MSRRPLYFRRSTGRWLGFSRGDARRLRRRSLGPPSSWHRSIRVWHYGTARNLGAFTSYGQPLTPRALLRPLEPTSMRNVLSDVAAAFDQYNWDRAVHRDGCRCVRCRIFGRFEGAPLPSFHWVRVAPESMAKLRDVLGVDG